MTNILQWPKRKPTPTRFQHEMYDVIWVSDWQKFAIYAPSGHFVTRADDRTEAEKIINAMVAGAEDDIQNWDFR